MNIVVNRIGQEINIQTLAELDIKDSAFFAAKSMRTKRGGNPFTLKLAAEIRIYANAKGITESELRKEVKAFIAQNPMRYYATSDRLVYLAVA